MSENLCIAATDVDHRYAQRVALKGVHVQARVGKMLGLLGPNGGGKSTLLGLLATRLRLQSGSVRILGLDLLTRQSEIRQRIGVVFQRPALDRRLTVYENLKYAGQIYGLHGQILESRIQELLSQFRLEDRRDERVEHLSGGLARRTELSKGLLHRPDLVLLDEPSTGLDPAARRDLWNVLHGLKESGVSVIVSTHLASEGEQCDDVVILNQGQVVAAGTPDGLRAEVGREILTLACEQPQQLAERLQRELQTPALSVEGKVRIETEQGMELMGRVMELFRDEIASFTLSRPSLEDVFFKKTGQSMDELSGGGAIGSIWRSKVRGS